MCEFTSISLVVSGQILNSQSGGKSNSDTGIEGASIIQLHFEPVASLGGPPPGDTIQGCDTLMKVKLDTRLVTPTLVTPLFRTNLCSKSTGRGVY